jgi:hypothetical protein
MLSTTLISVKLLLSFIFAVRSNPGYLEKGSGSEFNVPELMKKGVPSSQICMDCEVIKTDRSHHCHICNRCVDRWEGHCTWLNTCIGRGNSNMYMVWIFYVWLDVFLLGWIAMASIRVSACEIDHCVYDALCVGCHYLPYHYLVTVGDMLICFYYFFPSGYLCCLQFINYGNGETTNERFARNNRTASAMTDTDSQALSSQQSNKLVPEGEEGLLSNDR